jgi:hypothetical protein
MTRQVNLREASKFRLARDHRIFARYDGVRVLAA